MNYKYNNGDNVVYKSDGKEELCFIIKQRSQQGEPTYLIHNIETMKILDQIPETSLVKCGPNKIVDYYWDKIEYTGNNGIISKYIVNYILKNITNSSNVIWGPNNDNTTYSLKISNYPVWIKTLSN